MKVQGFYWLSFIYIVAFPGFLKAQSFNFLGGIGSGSSLVNSSLIFLSGNEAAVGFYGGAGNGYDSRTCNLISLAGIPFVMSFSGGNGQGSAIAINSGIFLNGQLFSPNFTGGIGRGNINSSTALVGLNGAIIGGVFDPKGGNGRGDALFTSANTTLDGPIQELLFRGGLGRGSDLSSQGFSLLSGAQYLSNYPGGIGNGNSIASINGTQLNGQLIFPNFNGGNGRGNFLSTTGIISLNGNIIGGVFDPKGGFGRGDALLASSNLNLNGSVPELLFRGGIGNGASISGQTGVFLSGTIFQVNFPGGIGRGSSTLKGLENSYLNGNIFSFSFSGGFGRGDFTGKSGIRNLNGIVSGAGLRIAANPILIFEAIKKRKNVLLSWKTSNDFNIKNFEIQASDNGHLFSSVCTLNSSQTNLESNYNLEVDSKLKLGPFYRLITNFLDSSSLKSDVLKIDSEIQNQPFIVFPNPVVENLFIIDEDNLAGFEENISVNSLSGRRILLPLKKLSEKRIEVETKGLPKGVYFIELNSKTEMERIKFVKI